MWSVRRSVRSVRVIYSALTLSVQITFLSVQIINRMYKVDEKRYKRMKTVKSGRKTLQTSEIDQNRLKTVKSGRKTLQTDENV
jgi:hypothetical protein